AEMHDAEGAEEGIDAAISEHRFADVVFAAFDRDGKILGISPSYSQQDSAGRYSRQQLLDALRPLLAAQGSFPFVNIADRGYRSYVRRFSVEGTEGALIVLQSLRRENEFLETLAATFGIVIPLAILLSGAGGYFLAQRSLAPVVAMSTQASQ